METTVNLPDYSKMNICELAVEIRKDWSKQKSGISQFAKGQLSAMFTMETVDSGYIAETGRDIIPRFLCNAEQWRGPVARAIKKELKKRLGLK